MDWRAFVCLIVCLWAVADGGGESEFRKRIYRQLNAYNNNFCWRLLSDQGQAGCQSKKAGTGTVAYLINSNETLDLYIRLTARSYVVVMNSSLLTRTSLSAMLAGGRTKALFVLKGNNSAAFSSGRQSPNAMKGLYHNDPAKRVAWNPEGGGENFEDLNIPMLLVEDPVDIEYLTRRAKRNHDIHGAQTRHPLFAAQINSWMTGALDAATCLRRGLCDRLGNWNVVGSIRPMVDNEDVIMGIAPLDSTSLFKSRTYGAATTVASFSVLLMAAEALGKVPKADQAPMNIVFAFFNGEAYDYIGSSRFAVDMAKGTFPGSADAKVGFPSVRGVIEVGQVAVRGNSAEPNALFVHRDPVTESQEATDRLVDTVVTSGSSAGVVLERSAEPNLLPPSSLQALLKWGNRQLPGVVIADHDSRHFANRFYQSFMDGPTNIGASDPVAMTNLCNVATTVARSLYVAAGGTAAKASAITADCTALQALVRAAVIAMNDTYTRSLFEGTDCEAVIKDHDQPLGLYVGVYNRNGPPCISSAFLSYLLLAKSLGEVVGDHTVKCPDMNKGLVVVGSQCYNASVNMTSAVSPGLSSTAVLNASFSMWTESRWEVGTPFARTYDRASPNEDLATLLVGWVVLLVSLGLMVLTMKFMQRTFKED